MKKIILIMGDITSIAVDAMVNTAHASLQGGSGLCYSIHKKGGSPLQDECKRLYKELGLLADGSAEVTVAGSLPAHHVIHAVSPRWQGGNKDEEKLLYETYKSILIKAEQVQAGVISIPAIATGIHGFPKQKATRIAMDALTSLLPACISVTTVLLTITETERALIYKSYFEECLGLQNGIHLHSLLPSKLC